MTFHTDVEYFKNVYFFYYVSRSVQVSADALRSQRNWSPWTRATGVCELPNMDARNQTQGLLEEQDAFNHGAIFSILVLHYFLCV